MVIYITVIFKAAYKAFTDGKFTEALGKMRSILLSLPLLVVETRNELTEAQQASPASCLFKIHFSYFSHIIMHYICLMCSLYIYIYIYLSLFLFLSTCLSLLTPFVAPEHLP